VTGKRCWELCGSGYHGQTTYITMHQEDPTGGMAEPGLDHEAVDQTLPLVHKSTRVRTAKNMYIPSHTGKRYGYSMTQIMEIMHEKLDGKLVQHMTKELRSVGEHRRPDVVGMVMVQLSMNAVTAKFGEAWTTKACCAKIKQVHMRNTSVPKHWQDLTAKQKVL